MHDAKGRELKVGDRVLIPAIVTELSPQEDYCNVSAESLFGRRPDELKEHFGAINTGVMLRANDGDTNDWPELRAAAEASAG
jgi:hypothetical protein